MDPLHKLTRTETFVLQSVSVLAEDVADLTVEGQGAYAGLNSGVPVGRGGEHPQDDVPAVHPDDGAGGVQQVEVEVGVTGNRAVQTGLQERRPLLLQDALGAAAIALAHPGHA